MPSDIVKVLLGKLSAWGTNAVAMLPNLVLAVLVFVGFIWLARLISRVAHNAFERGGMNEAAAGLGQSAVRIAVMFGGLMVALSILNLDKALASVLAGAGVIGLALGFAFQDLAANIISGIGLAAGASHPFKIGDTIETNGVLGNVSSINIRTTELETLDGRHVIIPNKQIYQDKLINYTATDCRRIELECGVSYAEDLEKVREVARDALQQTAGRKASRDIEILYREFGGSSINFVARVWVDYSCQGDVFVSQSDAVLRLKKAFDAAGIVIPFPIQTLDFGIKGGQDLTTMLNELPMLKPQSRRASNGTSSS